MPENDIRRAIADSVAAWNRGDLQAFVLPYAEDARFVSSKAVTIGRKPILKRYQKKYSNRALMGHLTIEIQHLTFSPGPAPTGATVIGRWRIQRDGGQILEGATLIVFHYRGEQWLIVEDHSS